MKLTKAQTDTLKACPDWSAWYEIMYRRHDTTGQFIDPAGQRQILSRLRNIGLVEYARSNDVFRITPAGRAALADGERS